WWSTPSDRSGAEGGPEPALRDQSSLPELFWALLPAARRHCQIWNSRLKRLRTRLPPAPVSLSAPEAGAATGNAGRKGSVVEIGREGWRRESRPLGPATGRGGRGSSMGRRRGGSA